MDYKKIKNSQSSVRQLATSVATYSGASIFGPLIFFLSIGYFLDKYYDKKPLFIIISLFIAFIVTNLLIFKKIKILLKNFQETEEKENEDKKI